MCQASCWNRESLDKVLTSDSSRSDLSLNFPDYVQLSCWLIIVCLGDTPLPAHLSGSSCLKCEELHEDRHSVREEDRRQEVSWARSVHLSLSLSLHFLSLSLCLCTSASGVIQELLINNSLITRSKWTTHVQLWMHDSVLMLFMNCHMINWTGQATVIPANAGKSSPSPHKPRCGSQPDATPELRGGVCDCSLVHQACWCELYSPAEYVMLDLSHIWFQLMSAEAPRGQSVCAVLSILNTDQRLTFNL